MSEITMTPRDEKILTQKVAPLFEQDSPGQIAGVRYGRKWLKVKSGLRTSKPPMTGLTSEQAADVRSALGIEPKQLSKKATPAKA